MFYLHRILTATDRRQHHREAHHHRPKLPIVEPDPGHRKLRLSTEGLEAIRRITNPVAAVAVIGLYRSENLFCLINFCHFLVMKDINGVKTSVFYLDTEGFESIGKSNVYDDRYVTSQLSLAVELAEEFYGRVKILADMFSAT
ncbi:hypothetical protein L2E82_43560 [Cichorium intybus]|uniref:Uncharacterized protein n=1 Tax=Cichorium intybus TaxID=13427 RepID=A0ACB8ZT78_CICIN|nr:hypothetical protein L2E82_43560 [Cichorium intybus]